MTAGWLIFANEEQNMLLGQQLDNDASSKHGNHWDTLLAVARAGEQAGLDSVWLADHFMFPDKEHPDKEVPVFDCFVALGRSPPAHRVFASASWWSGCRIATRRCWRRC
jgi:hypothetical protein